MTTRIHLARTGRFRDAHNRVVTVDADLLKQLAESYDVEKHKAPLVLGHPSDGAPAYGWVQELVIGADGDLYGEVGEVASDLSDAVRSGQYRNVSISWWPKGHDNSPDKDRPALRHVGILGAQTPVVKGLKPLSFAAADKDVIAIEFSDGAFGWRVMKDIARGFREFIIGTSGAEEADRVIPSYLVDSLGEAAERAENAAPRSFEDPSKTPETTIEDPSMSGEDPKKDPAVEFAEREAALKAREEKIKSDEAALAERAKAGAKSAAVAFADGLIKDGRLTPAGKDTVVDIHQRLARSDEPIAFADGTKAPALDAFEDLLNGAKPIINLGEITKDENAATIDGRNSKSLTARANQIVKEDGTISFSEAVRMAEKEAAK